LDPETDQIAGIRPRDINPMWAEVPLLVALARWGGGMIPFYRRKPGADDGSNGDNKEPTADDANYRYPPAP